MVLLRSPSISGGSLLPPRTDLIGSKQVVQCSAWPGKACPPPLTGRVIFLWLPRNLIILSRFPGAGLLEQSPGASSAPAAGGCSCASERDRLGMSLRSASNAVWTGSLSCTRGSEAPALSWQHPVLQPSPLPPCRSRTAAWPRSGSILGVPRAGLGNEGH